MGGGIIKGLNEAIAHERGQLKGVKRLVMKNVPLPNYKSQEIRDVCVKKVKKFRVLSH